MKATLKQLCLCACLALLASTAAFAQKKTFSDVLAVALRNSGHIVDEDLNISGYYMFYKVDRVDKKNNEYLLRILDQNLNETSSLKFIESNTLSLLEGSYNGSTLMLKFNDYNRKDGKVFYKSYDASGKLVSQKSRPQDTKNKFQNLYNSMEYQLFPIKNTGFVDYVRRKNKNEGFEIKYLPESTEAKAWTHKSDPESKMLEYAIYLASTPNVIFSGVTKVPAARSTDPQYYILGNNLDTGKKLFETKLEDTRYHIEPVGSALNEQTEAITVLGIYFNQGDKINKAKSLGLCAYTIDKAGEITDRKYISWADDVSKLLSVNEEGKIKGEGFFHFHDFIATADGKVYAIAEQYKKAASGAGIAISMMGGRASLVEMVIKDIFVFEFNSNFELTNITSFEKDESYASLPEGSALVSPALLARYINYLGAFDYAFTQRSRDKTTFSVGYYSRERNEKKKKTPIFGIINYADGKLTSDKMDLKTDASDSKVLPAKNGYIMVMEYFKKEKKLETRLEKINF